MCFKWQRDTHLQNVTSNIFSSVFARRLEFDAYRSDLEELSLGPRDAAAIARIDTAQQQYQAQKDKYERLRSDVIIKLKFLEENKVGVHGVRAGPLGKVKALVLA